MGKFYDRAMDFWNETNRGLSERSWNKRLKNSDLGLPHYQGFLLETYHNTGKNPQLQGYTTLFFETLERDIVKKFFQHAISEIAHDLLAMDDLINLGVEKSFILKSKPLPTTSALFSHSVYMIQKFGAPAYLAYLFNLEVSPIVNGPHILSLLKTKGVPKNATTFLEEHIKVDVQHLKLINTYMESLLKTNSSQEIFFNSLYDNVVLQNRMLEASFENGEALFSSKISSAVS